MVSCLQPYRILSVNALADTLSFVVKDNEAGTVDIPHSSITVLPSKPARNVSLKLPAVLMGPDNCTVIVLVTPLALQFPLAPVTTTGTGPVTVKSEPSAAIEEQSIG